MSYDEHYKKITTTFQELDLIKKSDFDLFKNLIFVEETIDSCIKLSENAAKKLKIPLHFGILYNHTFNGSAKIKNGSAVIIFNLGLINKLEAIISESIELLMHENIASMTIKSDEKDNLKKIVQSCCITYIFYHELAHIIQLLETNLNTELNLQEQYSRETHFKIKKHIYEIDADNFGSVMSAHLLLEKIMNSNYQFETIILFNSLSSLLFTISNIIIEFSGNLFQNIYYKENSHPHPLIRIVESNEQIISFVSKNLNVPKPLFEATLQRAGSMISQIIYSNERKINLPELLSQNFEEISNYIDEIEILNENYKELTRHKSQKIFNALIM